MLAENARLAASVLARPSTPPEPTLSSDGPANLDCRDQPSSSNISLLPSALYASYHVDELGVLYSYGLPVSILSDEADVVMGSESDSWEAYCTLFDEE